MSENKTQPTATLVTEFIQQLDNPKRQTDALILLNLFNDVTGWEPVMWGSSIVGYGEYTYTLANGKQGIFMRTGFSPRKQNMTLYIMAGFNQKQHLVEKLGKHKTGKSCLYVNKLEDVDLNIVEELIKADLAIMKERYPQ